MENSTFYLQTLKWSGSTIRLYVINVILPHFRPKQLAPGYLTCVFVNISPCKNIMSFNFQDFEVLTAAALWAQTCHWNDKTNAVQVWEPYKELLCFVNHLLLGHGPSYFLLCSGHVVYRHLSLVLWPAPLNPVIFQRGQPELSRDMSCCDEFNDFFFFALPSKIFKFMQKMHMFLEKITKEV